MNPVKILKAAAPAVVITLLVLKFAKPVRDWVNS